MSRTRRNKATQNVRPLSFRDFPTDLYWKCKEQAVRRRMSFKHYVIRALEEAVGRDSKELKVKFHAGEESGSSSDDV